MSRACSQVHESIDEGHLDIKKDHSTSEDKGAQWDDKAAQADNNGEGLKGDNDEKSALLHPIKKRCRSAVEKKLPLKRCVKRRFSSPLSSDDGTETGPESDTGSYVPAKPCRTSNRQSFSSPLSTGRERKPNSVDALESANGRLKRRPFSRTTVVDEQQCLKEEIVQRRDVRQGRGRPRKQYRDVSTSDTDTCSTQSYGSHSSLSASQSTSEPNGRSRAQAATVSDQEEWEVSEVLDERWIEEREGKTGKQYLVRWKVTWVDESDIHASDLVEQFRARLACTE